MKVVSFVLLLFVLIGKFMESSTNRSDSDNDYDSAWEELFGHLSVMSLPSAEPLHANLDMSDSKLDQTMDVIDQSKSGIDKHSSGYELPVPPAPPFVYDPTEQDKNPGVGAHSYGNMEGIAISQNGGIALGMYIMNSSYNNFNTLFGSAPSSGKVGSRGTGLFQVNR